ncbi:MAG TPA: hypothetical protein PKB10_02325, partial [Tepidisphaeraceae bacterium]|nr:hypothetical protein [Tepidisphaeraceae bacterium]
MLPIVEGHGDAAAVPVLIHRIWRDLLKLEGTLVVLPPIREKRASFPVADKLRRPLELAASKLAQAGPGRKLILVMFDADDDCIRDLSASVRMTCQTYVGHMNFKCVIANPMFETWIVAGAETLQQHLDLSDGDVPDGVEAERCRKWWIQHR